MPIAAILTVAAEESPRRVFSLVGRSSRESAGSYANVEILGASLLERTLQKLRDLQTIPPKVLSGRHVSDHVLPLRSAKSGTFIDAWEKAVADYVNGGAETLLLIRVGPYADLPYAEVMRFHAETRAAITQVYGSDGSLDVAVVNATLLRNTDDLVRRALSHLIPEQQRFRYEGYVNRLRNREDLHRLMQDGLHGRCNLRPVGTEVSLGVWCAEGSHIESGATVHGPAFVGRDSKIASGCVITGTSSIERDCEIDCGTVIDDSLVLQGTYVGMALDVSHSVIGNERLFNLARNVEVSVSDPRLIGRKAKPVAGLGGLTSLLRNQASAGD